MNTAAVWGTSTWAFALGDRSVATTGDVGGWRKVGELSQLISDAYQMLAKAETPPGVWLGTRPPRVVKLEAERRHSFYGAFYAGLELSAEMVAADETDPIDLNVWISAIKQLAPLASRLSAPLVSPLQLGGVAVEWHELGINIEMRFRGIGDVFVVIEDAHGEIKEFYGPDPELSRAFAALSILAQRKA